MSILVGRNLAKSFGADDIFSEVSIEIPHRSRIALVGPNGAGKTTLLHMLIGEEMPSEGDVTRSRGLRIGFLPQRPELHGSHTVWEEQLTPFAALRETERELTRLEHAMTDPAQYETVFARYGHLQEQFERDGGYTYEQRIRTVLHGLGFKPDDHETPLARLSGGQKTRALLARLLLEAPDLLLLDEPTNHLDVGAIEWLEGYLNEFEGAVLVVSHDRYFMDAVAGLIWELDFGTLETYKGNYSAYANQRAERHERRLKEYEAQQEFIAKEEEYIRRNLAGQNVAQAKGRRTRLERLKRDKLAAAPRTRSTMTLRLQSGFRSGDKVVIARDLVVGYPDAPAPLFRAPDFTLYRGEAAALIGANGAGKSTLVKTIIGQLQPLEGEVKLGSSVKVGYFAQAHESLTPSHTLIDEIHTAKLMPISETRAYLGRFQFTGDDAYRTVDTLSGGERGRVALAKLALMGANLLLLDEPTNHLDIASQEILQNVLADFGGTILLVSHDRYLVNALATQIWSVTPGKLDVFDGPYTEFIAARTAAAQPAPSTSQGEGSKVVKSNGAAKHGSTHGNGAKPNGNSAAKTEVVSGNGANGKKDGLNAYQRQKRVAVVEATIVDLEARLETLNTDIAQASAGGDAGRAGDLGRAYLLAEADLHAAMSEWEALLG